MIMLTDYLFELIFPECCIFCGRPLKIHCEKTHICEACSKKMPYLGQDTYNDEHGKIRGISVFRYDAVKDSIFRFKYDGYKNYGIILGKYMAQYVIENSIDDILKADILIPVPLWRKKEKERGFNQSAVLAETISDIVKVPWDSDILLRNRKTVPQKGLSRGRRKDNLRGAFSIRNGKSVVNKKVVLIDDIYTTGSTIYECSKILYGAGADDVVYLALSAPGTEAFEVEFEEENTIKSFDE